MQLFLANCLTQSLDFYYRVIEDGRLIKQLVPSGDQKKIGNDNFNRKQIDAIIKSYSCYGIFEVNDYEKIGSDQPITGVFSIDSPVDGRVIQQIFDHNKQATTALGANARRDLALAVAKIMGGDNDKVAERATVTIEEADRGTMSLESGNKLEEGYTGPDSPVARSGNVKKKR